MTPLARKKDVKLAIFFFFLHSLGRNGHNLIDLAILTSKCVLTNHAEHYHWLEYPSNNLISSTI